MLISVRVLLTKDDPEAETMALEVFAILERDYAGKLSVQLLNLQLLSRDKVSNGDKFFASEFPYPKPSSKC